MATVTFLEHDDELIVNLVSDEGSLSEAAATAENVVTVFQGSEADRLAVLAPPIEQLSWSGRYFMRTLALLLDLEDEVLVLDR